jgi:hypothetical protein
VTRGHRRSAQVLRALKIIGMGKDGITLLA